MHTCTDEYIDILIWLTYLNKKEYYFLLKIIFYYFIFLLNKSGREMPNIEVPFTYLIKCQSKSSTHFFQVRRLGPYKMGHFNCFKNSRLQGSKNQKKPARQKTQTNEMKSDRQMIRCQTHPIWKVGRAYQLVTATVPPQQQQQLYSYAKLMQESGQLANLQCVVGYYYDCWTLF